MLYLPVVYPFNEILRILVNQFTFRWDEAIDQRYFEFDTPAAQAYRRRVKRQDGE